MYISRKLKEQSISEYLLYMWQVEDMIRANGCDVERLEQTVVAAYNLPEEQRAELTEWYANLVEMMHLERVEQSGHLQINKNVIITLTDLHFPRHQHGPLTPCRVTEAIPGHLTLAITMVCGISITHALLSVKTVVP